MIEPEEAGQTPPSAYAVGLLYPEPVLPTSVLPSGTKVIPSLKRYPS